jgi:serine/threonine-protein kinase
VTADLRTIAPVAGQARQSPQGETTLTEVTRVDAQPQRRDDPTVGSSNTGATSPTTLSTDGTRFGTLLTASDALHVQEIGRTRAFARVSVVFAALVMLVLPITHGDPLARWIAIAGMSMVGIGGALLALRLRDEAAYTVEAALAFGFVCVVGGYGAIYYFGVFSPAAAVIAYGLFFWGTGQSFSGTLSIYLCCAISHAALSLSVTSGLLQDRGMVRADELSALDQLVTLTLVEATFFATFLVARATRRATIEAIERHDAAVRALAQRDALLKEARQDLERALHAGGVGRFTDETLGSFRLATVLGRGGMGEVYEAVHTTTKDAAAVKVLHSTHLADPEAVRRFLREAKIAASLDVPNVVRVLEIGGLESPVPYIAMERLRGEDLAELLRVDRRLAMRKVLHLLRQVGRGLDAARAAGIVHRDIKPRNLFLAEDGDAEPTWKILDFGVSKLSADHGATLTRELVIGTPSYMAPEQAAGRSVDYRADLHALAVITYRAITGRPAFTGDVVAEILYKVVHSMPPRPSTVARVPEELDVVLAIALAKDPAARFDSGAALYEAFDAAVRGEIGDDLRRRAAALIVKNPWGI